MATPTPGRFRQADAILDAAIDLEPGEREAFVDRACEGKSELRSLVIRLLRAYERSGEFLSGGAVDLAGPLLDEEDSEPDEPPEFTPPPDRVGPYKVLDILGRGGMGVVYLAVRGDAFEGPPVALKTIRGGTRATGTVLRRFLAERRILADLEHPYIAQLVESGITPTGSPYFAMAYCAGGSLARRLEDQALPEAEALRVARQLAEALAAAHTIGIVHRDIKPANVLFNAVGDVQLTDFGVAKFLDQDTTQSGTLLGTPAYLAPEQIRGDGADHRADLWALGVSMYQMLTGRRPFDGPSYAVVLNAVLTAEPDPLDRLISVPPALAGLIHHLLQKNPDDRPQSAEVVVETLAAIEENPGASYTPRPATPRGSAAGTPAGVRGTSIVVMPFKNTSGSVEDAPFTDGLTDELISNLGKVRGLRVTARSTAFALAGRGLDVRAVSNLIGVAYLLEGSVRRAGERIKVTAQLVKADEGEVVWSETYNRQAGDIFAVEEEVGAAIVTALAPALGPTVLIPVRARHRDVAAYDLYLRGRYFWQKRVAPDLERAAEYFRQATALDPEYAEAYAGIADAYIVLIMLCGRDPREMLPHVRTAAAEAIRLGSGIPLVHSTRGHLLTGFDWSWEEGEAELRRAVELDPGIVDARQYLIGLLQHLSRFDEAIEIGQEALLLDPLSPAVNLHIGRAHLHAGQPAVALPYLRSAVEIAPNFPIALQQLGHVLLQLGETEEALLSFRRAVETGGRLETGHLAYALAVSGHEAEARDLMNRFLHDHTDGYVPPYSAAVGYAGLGDLDAAIEWLTCGVDQHAAQIAAINVAPPFVRLHGDPRFHALLVRMNLATGAA